MKAQLLVLMEALVHQRKIFILILTKQRPNSVLILHYTGDNSCLFVNEQEIFKFKVDNKNVSFSTQFCVGSIPNGFHVIESGEVRLGGNVYDFSVQSITILLIGLTY